MSDGPTCPACDRPARAAMFDGVVRWTCGGPPECPCVCYEDSWHPSPRLGPTPAASRRPAGTPLFSGRRS